MTCDEPRNRFSRTWDKRCELILVLAGECMEITPQNRDSQISLRSIFWVMTAGAILLAYAQSLGPLAVHQAIVYSSVAIVTGGVVGLLFRRIKDAIYWSGLISCMAYLAIAGGRLPTDAIVYAWAVLAAVAGAVSGVIFPRKLWLTMTGMSFFGAGVMTLFLKIYGVPMTDLVKFDVYCAVGIGAAIPAAVFAIMFSESKYPCSRWIMAAWLSMSVMVGNMLVPVLGGVQR